MLTKATAFLGAFFALFFVWGFALTASAANISGAIYTSIADGQR